MRRAILARHGESEYSLRGAINGDPTVAVRLTDEGRGQAQRLGDLLRDEPIDLCVTSEFGRVTETADLALAGRDVPRLVLRELNDISVGAWEGKPLEEYRVWARASGPEDVTEGGGESRADTIRRYVRGFRAVLARPERTILVVTHGLPIRYLLNAAQEVDPAPIAEAVGYAEPHRFDADELERALDRLDRWCAAPAW
jgi:broad specificity phosphatase PhoE